MLCKTRNLQCNVNKESANADLVHHRELDCVQKDVKLKNAKEHLITQQVQMLQLQIQLEEMR
jgi:hypothetical protein